MKKNDLTTICNWLRSQHIRRTLADDGGKVTVFYPRKNFPSVDIQALRKRFNNIMKDVQARQIVEHDCLVIYDTVPLDNLNEDQFILNGSLKIS